MGLEGGREKKTPSLQRTLPSPLRKVRRDMDNGEERKKKKTHDPSNSKGGHAWRGRPAREEQVAPASSSVWFKGPSSERPFSPGEKFPPRGRG